MQGRVFREGAWMVPILRISSQLYEPTDAARMRSFHQLVNSGHVDVHHSILVALSMIYPVARSIYDGRRLGSLDGAHDRARLGHLCFDDDEISESRNPPGAPTLSHESDCWNPDDVAALRIM